MGRKRNSGFRVERTESGRTAAHLRRQSSDPRRTLGNQLTYYRRWSRCAPSHHACPAVSFSSNDLIISDNSGSSTKRAASAGGNH